MATITLGSQGLLDGNDVTWRIKAGADAFAGPFVLWNDAEKTEPTDLSGVTGTCELRTKTGGALLATAMVAIGGDDSNEVRLHVSAADSADWSPKQTAGVFDVLLTDGSGVVTCLVTGSLDILPLDTTGDE